MIRYNARVLYRTISPGCPGLHPTEQPVVPDELSRILTFVSTPKPSLLSRIIRLSWPDSWILAIGDREVQLHLVLPNVFASGLVLVIFWRL